MRTNLAGDRQTITLWPVEVYSRRDRSRLPFRRIWQSTRSNFSPCSQPQHFRTVQGIFSRELVFPRHRDRGQGKAHTAPPEPVAVAAIKSLLPAIGERQVRGGLNK